MRLRLVPPLVVSLLGACSGVDVGPAGGDPRATLVFAAPLHGSDWVGDVRIGADHVHVESRSGTERGVILLSIPGSGPDTFRVRYDVSRFRVDARDDLFTFVDETCRLVVNRNGSGSGGRVDLFADGKPPSTPCLPMDIAFVSATRVVVAVAKTSAHVVDANDPREVGSKDPVQVDWWVVDLVGGKPTTATAKKTSDLVCGFSRRCVVALNDTHIAYFGAVGENRKVVVATSEEPSVPIDKGGADRDIKTLPTALAAGNGTLVWATSELPAPPTGERSLGCHVTAVKPLEGGFGSGPVNALDESCSALWTNGTELIVVLTNDHSPGAPIGSRLYRGTFETKQWASQWLNRPDFLATFIGVQGSDVILADAWRVVRIPLDAFRGR